MASTNRQPLHRVGSKVTHTTRRRVARNLAAALMLFTGMSLAPFALAQLPQAETVQGIKYVTGGFGSEEAAAFKAGKVQYPVSLTFAATDEDGTTPYVADVSVEFVDEQGKAVLSLPSVGPYLLVDLPAGSYTVRASYEGREQTQTIKVGGVGSVDVRIAWKRSGSGPD